MRLQGATRAQLSLAECAVWLSVLVTQIAPCSSTQYSALYSALCCCCRVQFSSAEQLALPECTSPPYLGLVESCNIINYEQGDAVSPILGAS